MLDLGDILLGATSGTIDQFLDFTSDGTDTTITVDANGSADVSISFTDLTITLNGVVITNGQDVQDMITDGNLIIT